MSITFSTSKGWELVGFNTNGTWITLSNTTGGKGVSTISFSILANEDTKDRTNSYTLSCGTIYKKITITQKGRNTLTLSTSKFEVPSEGGEIDIQVKANVDYEIDIPAEYKSWIHSTSTRTALTTTHNCFQIDKSEEYDKREAIIKVTSNLGVEDVHVYQVGEAVLVLSENIICVSEEGGHVNIAVSSNFDYDVQMPSDTWVHYGNTRAIKTSSLAISVDPNPEYISRSTNIVVYDRNSEKKETITINQNEMPRPDNTPSWVEAVDLGLPSGLLWASCNVGANKATDIGTYVSWGEISGVTWKGTDQKWDGKLDFTEENYKYYKSATETYRDGNFVETKTYTGYTKYVYSNIGFKGFKDNKTILDPEDDFATIRWGGKWRTPTADELQELKEKCNWTFGTMSGRTGCKITGPNGNWIFIPESGYCQGIREKYFNNPDDLFTGNWWYGPSIIRYDRYYYYCWSSTTKMNNIRPLNPDDPYYLTAENYTAYLSTARLSRYHGLPIRPVRKR